MEQWLADRPGRCTCQHWVVDPVGTVPGPGREVAVVQLMAVAGRTAIDCNQVYNLEKKKIVIELGNSVYQAICVLHVLSFKDINP